MLFEVIEELGVFIFKARNSLFGRYSQIFPRFGTASVQTMSPATIFREKPPANR